MERDFDKEIKEARDKVKHLEAEKHQEFIKTLPDLKGKYFRAAWKTFYKVIEVVDANEYDEIYCDVFYIAISEDDTKATIKSFDGECEVSLKGEISKEEFVKWYNKAQEIISKSV